MTATATSPTTTKRHPIRGFLYGIVFGLGLAMIAIGQKWVALGTWPPFIIFIVGIVIGTAWSTFGPAKAPKGASPTRPADPSPPPAPEPEDSPAEATAAETEGEAAEDVVTDMDEADEPDAGIDSEA